MNTNRRDDLIRKIEALQAKAKSTDSPHEAENCTRKAIELIARYSITDTELREASHDPTKMGSEWFIVDLGPITDGLIMLWNYVAERFGAFAGHINQPVDPRTVPTDQPLTEHARLVRVFGTPEAIDLTETTINLLTPQLVSAVLRLEPVDPVSYACGWAEAVDYQLARSMTQAQADQPDHLPVVSSAAARQHAIETTEVRHEPARHQDRWSRMMGQVEGLRADVDLTPKLPPNP